MNTRAWLSSSIARKLRERGALLAGCGLVGRGAALTTVSAVASGLAPVLFRRGNDLEHLAVVQVADIDLAAGIFPE